MKIVNINSEIELTPLQHTFVEELVFYGDRDYYRERDSFDTLLKKIPIFLLNEKSMQKYDSKNSMEFSNEEIGKYEVFLKNYEKNSDYNPSTEWLGFYGRSSDDVFERTSRIVICLERIATCVQNEQEFMFLLTKVIVHELAHAKMDVSDQNKKYRKKDLFWNWMEESSANRYTLEIFENFHHRRYSRINYYKNHSNYRDDDKLWDFITNFIKKQPPQYALGYELFKKRPLLNWEWERNKERLGGSKRINEKQKLLAYLQQNYKNLDRDKASKLFDDVFDR